MQLKNKTILLRIDINSEIINGKPQDSARFSQHAKTISALKKQKAKVVIIAHQGSPKSKDFTSLKHHAKILSKYTKVSFTKNPLDTKAIHALRPSQALLLENIRFLKEEFKPSTKSKIVKTLTPLADFYINDAFSICHRNQTSIVSLPKSLPSLPGPALKSEVQSLKKLNLSKTLFILGGSKTEDNISLLTNPKVKKVLPGGFLALLTLKASGKSLGKKQEKILKPLFKYLPKIKRNLNKITLPKDLAIQVNKKRKTISTNQLPTNHLLLDLGLTTTSEYIKQIKKAKVIFFRGALGYCEDKRFCLSTSSVIKAIVKSKSYSVIGGGNTLPIIERLKIPKSSFNYISLSGGALTQYIQGKTLPGLKALGTK